MEKFKQLKCGNCGSSDFKQISEDLFECVYCSAKAKNENSIKDDFLKSLSSNSKTHKSIHFIKPTVSEEDFYKRAVTFLQMNKNSPRDILNSEFSFVDYGYKFFVILDVDFFVLNTKNIVEQTFESTLKTSLNITSQESSTYSHGKYFNIPISADISSTELDQFSNSVDFLSTFDEMLASETKGVKLPPKELIEGNINSCIGDYKEKSFPEKIKSSNYIVHKINKVDFYAIPCYKLEYTYKNQKYQLSSFAHTLNISGKIPDGTNENKKELTIKKAPFSIASSLMAVAALIFAFIHLGNRAYSWIITEVVLIGATALLFGINLISDKIINKTHYRKKFKERKENLLSFLNKQYQLSEQDLAYIDSIERWW